MTVLSFPAASPVLLLPIFFGHYLLATMFLLIHFLSSKKLQAYIHTAKTDTSPVSTIFSSIGIIENTVKYFCAAMFRIITNGIIVKSRRVDRSIFFIVLVVALIRR